MSEERLYSVTDPHIKCCAKDCIPNVSDRFFFTFPPCDESDEASVERCGTWVRRAGNIDLLQCKSSELAGRFYLCCHHFPDWTAVSSNQRYIAANAYPTIFDCSPLTKLIMKCFPVTSEHFKRFRYQPSEPGPLPGPLPETMHCLETSKEKDGDSDPACLLPSLDGLDIIKREHDDAELNNGCARKNSDALVSGDGKLVHEKRSSPPAKKTPRTYLPKKSSSRPSRKAKQDAVDRISKQLTPKDSDMSPDASSPDSSYEDSGESTSSTAATPKAPPTYTVNSLGYRIVVHDAEAPERTSAKCRIVSKDLLSKLGARLAFKGSQPVVLVPNNTLAEAGQVPASQPRNEKSVVHISPPHPQASLLKKPTGMKIVNPSPRNSLPSASSIEVIPVERMQKSPSASSEILLPIQRTTSTQTETISSENERLVLKILNSDSKLSVFTGLPSYEVLDKLTDATLKMVMSNKTAISDIEPTLRVWIMMTCTKLMLQISTKALSVMYNFAEDECQKIVEKTCLFLRKTLSLAECQKYIWVLPAEILNGIADFSESMMD